MRIHRDLSKDQINALLINYFNVIKEGVIQGKINKIRGFGKFVLKKTPARTARNPKSGMILNEYSLD